MKFDRKKYKYTSFLGFSYFCTKLATCEWKTRLLTKMTNLGTILWNFRSWVVKEKTYQLPSFRQLFIKINQGFNLNESSTAINYKQKKKLDKRRSQTIVNPVTSLVRYSIISNEILSK